MKKLLKRLTVIAVIAVTVLGVLCFAACGDKNEVVGTYKITFSKSELTGNIRHSGYIANGDCEEVNTLVLKDDMTYEYTKYITTDVASAASLRNAEREAADANILFSWTAKGTCTFDCYKDGTYKFTYPGMNVSETGKWEWKGWKFKVITNNGKEITAVMDDGTRSLSFEYIADMNERLKDTFTCASSVWGPALGQTGAYTPESGSNPEQPTPPSATYTGPVKISYKFTGTYTTEGKTVTLAPATGCVWSEDWGNYQNYGFTNVSGRENDLVFPKGPTGRSFHPLNHFGGKYYFAPNNDAGVEITNNNAFKVNVDKEAGTFAYIEESSFD
ncbi:MAG: hypothetical protein HFK09_02525 [Clostridia bacterium]|nr:hypothetical protein [Clostridia bacterium]